MSTAVDGETRKYVAVLGRRYFSGSVTRETLFENFGNTEDPLIQEFLIAVASEPRRGFWGIRESRWQKVFWLPVSRLLAELENGEAGRVPDVVVVTVSRWTLFGFAIFILWTAASVMEHGLESWRGVAPWWSLALHAVFAVLLAAACLGGIVAFRDRLLLHRIRRGRQRSSVADG